jgi:hypothetical protein
MCAGAGFTPGERVELMLDRNAKQLVPCRVELDLVDAVSVPVVGPQLRPVLVCLDGAAPNVGTAGECSDRPQPLLCPLAPLALHRLDQRPVRFEGVVIHQRRWLVGDLVRVRALLEHRLLQRLYPRAETRQR